MAVIVHQFHPSAGDRHANGARERCTGRRVAAGRGAGFGQTIALANRTTGFGQPQLGYGAGHGHATANRDLEVAPIDGVKIRVIGQTVKQGVDRRETVEGVLGQLFELGRDVAWIRNQNRLGTGAHAQHHVHSESKDVIERQGTHRCGLLA